MRRPVFGTALAERLAQCSSGVAAVEFALVVPTLLLMMFGIGIYGLYLGAAHNLRQITAEAARASVGGVSDAERADLARARVTAALAGGSMFRPGSISVEVGPDPSDAALYTVTLAYDARALGLSGLYKLVPMPPDTLRTTISVRRGGL